MLVLVPVVPVVPASQQAQVFQKALIMQVVVQVVLIHRFQFAKNSRKHGSGTI
jgi:hypothetical protein